MYGSAMSTKLPLLLIGRLFGSTTDALRERFDIEQVDDFDSKIGRQVDPTSLRAVCIGMVGSGHISHMAVDGTFIDQFPHLELLACLGVGCEYVDHEAVQARGVVATNTPGANTQETADTAMGLLLSVVRQLPQADRYLREGHWLRGMFPLTGTLRNKTLGILGLGNIGKAIARRAEPFGLEIIYHGRKRQAVPYAYAPSPLELAERSDILMIVVPGGDETFNMVNADVIRALGSNGVLINIARGTVVDEAALVDALRDRVIHTAAIDAFEFEPHAPLELIAMPHLVLTPHVGSGTHYTRELMSQAVVDNLIAWADGRSLPSPMD
jgi:lactate dehydrogenase-like 2-hydroxyacid dehydrogenase